MGKLDFLRQYVLHISAFMAIFGLIFFEFLIHIPVINDPYRIITIFIWMPSLIESLYTFKLPRNLKIKFLIVTNYILAVFSIMSTDLSNLNNIRSVSFSNYIIALVFSGFCYIYYVHIIDTNETMKSEIAKQVRQEILLMLNEF